METKTVNTVQWLFGVIGQVTIVFTGLLYFYGGVGFETAVIMMLFCVPLLFHKPQ